MSTRTPETIAINPTTGKESGRSPLHTREDLQRMLTAAREAQPAWATLSVKQRARRFAPMQDFLLKNMDRLARIISEDNGKVAVDALATEVLPAILGTSFYRRKAPRMLRDQKSGGSSLAFVNKRTKIRRVPYGVLGIISPWNYPYSIAFTEVLMGLLAGNAVVLKTASETQMVGLALKETFEAADLPSGLFHYINLPGREAGPAFLECDVDKLFFTGSVPVGKLLMRQAADTLTPVNLELGGNDAMIVCADANLDRAVNGAVWAGLSNSGQSCGGVERVYVQDEIYQAFLNKLKRAVEQLRPVADNSTDCDLGVMTTEKQKQSVQQHIDDALNAGATIFAQSSHPGSQFKTAMPATVLTNVSHEMDVMRHETFGPVLGVMPFKSIEEAITLANDSYLGLTASVWTKNRRKGRKIARRLQAGAVTVNDHLMSHGLHDTSWGGFKQSGIGRTHGLPGFMEMTQTQMIVDDWFGRFNRNLWWQPYSEKIYLGLKGLMEALHGRGMRTRLLGLWRLLRIVPRMFTH